MNGLTDTPAMPSMAARASARAVASSRVSFMPLRQRMRPWQVTVPSEKVPRSS